jgi:hypothetical protein
MAEGRRPPGGKGRVTGFLGIGRSQSEIDFVDVDIYGDVPLFVNPGALRKSHSEWAERCTMLMQDFMKVVIEYIRDDNTDEAYRLLLYLGEPNETHLGLSAKGGPAKGHAVGSEFAELIINAIQKSAAGRTGLIIDLEDTVMMIEGIGSDVISDITTNIIRGPLIEYTNEMCDLYGVDTSAFQSRQDQPVWDLDAHTWDQPDVTLPVANGRPLILVPKWIVRKQVNVDSYFRDYLRPFIVQRELEDPNSEFIRVLKNKTRKPNLEQIQKEFGSKAGIVKLLTDKPELYGKYRGAVNAGDPSKPSDQSVLGAVNAAPPNLDTLLAEIVALPVGAKAARAYETSVDRLFSAMFTPMLRYPRPQQPQNTGQKVLDVLWINAAESGFFSWVKDQCNASYIISEYKNYGSEIGNPEFDQLAMRFGPSKGQFGFLICRKIENREAAVKRAREIRTDKHGFIIALDDGDLSKLVDSVKQGADSMFEYLVERFTQVAH